MRRIARLAAVEVLLVAFALTVSAQNAADRTVAKPLMMAKDVDPDWEVVTVKPSDPNDHYDRFDANGAPHHH